jgi:branched-chain amino acid transport system substrate-binding protein
MARALARHIYNSGVRQIMGVYDLGNQAFTETYWDEFKRQYEELGGDASQILTFTSGATDLKAVVEAINSGPQPTAILFITSPVDTALLAQYLQQLGVGSRLFSSTWAQSEQLLDKGGAAVEGMVLAAVFDPNDQRPAYAALLALRRVSTPAQLGRACLRAVLVAKAPLRRKAAPRPGASAG